MKIIFIRHGQSMGNVWGGAYHDDSYNFLSLRGVKQAELAAYTIDETVGHIDHLYTSNLTRAKHTATTIMQSMGGNSWMRDYHTNDKLNEWCFDAPVNIDWYTNEREKDFDERVYQFYTDVIIPFSPQDGVMMIVSHYYTMFRLFNYIDNTITGANDITKLDITGPVAIPNAIPYVWDTNSDMGPQIISPERSVSH